MLRLCRKSNLKVTVINSKFVFETTYLLNLNAEQAYNLWAHYHNYSFETFKTMVEDRVKFELNFSGKI